MSPRHKGLIVHVNKIVSPVLPPSPALKKRHKLFIAHLELSLIKGTNGHLVT